MKLRIRYRAHFVYEKEVSFSPHTVRLFPRRDKFLSVERMSFSVSDEVDIQYRSDLFDNTIAVCFLPQARKELPIFLDLDLNIEERNPFHFLLAPRAEKLPVAYTGEEAAALIPCLQVAREAVSWPGELLASVPESTVEALVFLNSWIHDNIAYERREEGDPYSPAEMLALGRGSCRDMAVFLAELLRVRGVASRLVSGFLWEPEEGERVAENALHAWVEAYVPGAGWIGLDPTNGVFADHHRVAAAAGLLPAQIAPVEGHYYGREHVPSKLDATLEIFHL